MRELKFEDAQEALNCVHWHDLFTHCKPAWMKYKEWWQRDEGAVQISGERKWGVSWPKPLSERLQ